MHVGGDWHPYIALNLGQYVQRGLVADAGEAVQT